MEADVLVRIVERGDQVRRGFLRLQLAERQRGMHAQVGRLSESIVTSGSTTVRPAAIRTRSALFRTLRS